MTSAIVRSCLRFSLSLLVWHALIAQTPAIAAPTIKEYWGALTSGCARLLLPTNWVQQYQAARERNDVRGGAVAIARLVVQYGPTWLVHPKTQKNFQIAAEVLAGRAGRLRALSVEGPEQVPFVDGRTFRDRTTARLKRLAVELAWASGPFWFRATSNPSERVGFFRTFYGGPEEFLRKHQADFSRLGIEADGFFEASMKTLHPDSLAEIDSRIRYKQGGRIPRSAFLAWVLFSSGLHPIQFADRALQPPSAIPTAAYFDDLQSRASVPMAGKNIAIIADRYFFLESLRELPEEMVGDIALDALRNVHELQVLSESASGVSLSLVSDATQLNQALQKSGDADIVMVLAHGEPGDFFLGPQRERISASLGKIQAVDFKKPDPVLVFLSCQLASRQPQRERAQGETWKRFADSVFAKVDGRAFALVPDALISVRLESPLPAQAPGHRRQSGAPALLTVLQGTGIPWVLLTARAEMNLWNPYDHLGDFREYRTKDGSTLLYETNGSRAGGD